MKQFVNKPTEITSQRKDGIVEEINFAELALKTLDLIPREGWTSKEMRLRFKIEDKLKAGMSKKIIELEDADVEKLYELAQIPWQFKHRDILDYQDHLEELIKQD